ncbi:alpha-hydroxy-acid oxidizing protein [Burkholderiaceae bacterium FT117]|uniref:alpha-hydroxy acid oxidase n=1 Tax=Zeimonas sediminis TaxID=2944268 RepID=UPI002342E22A|nr:alpha-hydroxy acid oxidase [Zeimonas sediminis]MCM5570406.1 alpha-hydroxy-acid oxidizing protein [Zeimonas sediminis]
MSRSSGWRHKAINVDAMRRLARRKLPRPVFDFADGGAETEWTLRRNEGAFARKALVPRPLNGAAQRDLSTTLFRHRLSMPLMIGPTGLAGLFWPDGELCSARAAAAAGIGYCLSHGSVCTIEELAALRTEPRWMQVFVYRDRGLTREFTDRAAAAGYHALVLTVDNQLLGNRERDLRNGFGIPPRFTPWQLLAMAPQLPWLWRMRNALPRLTMGSYLREGSREELAALAGRLASLLDPSMDWDDVRALREQWKGPLLLKGILHPDEARQATALGVDGLIVSNHGGRQLDGAISSIEALPGIVAAARSARPDLPILIDGGIRRGADLAKALALGATAGLIGRPQLWGLATAGEAGVAHLLEIYRREFDRAMGLLGAARVDELGPDLLAEAPPLG